MVAAADAAPAAPAADGAPAGEGAAGEPERAAATPGAQLAALLGLLERAVKVKDTKLLVGRLLRQTAAVRKQLTPDVLAAFLEEALPQGHPTRAFLQAQVSKAGSEMDTEADAAAQAAPAEQAVLPEVEAFAFLLVITLLIDAKAYEQAKEVAGEALRRLAAFNRRTLDGLTARIYFFYSWAHECTDSLKDIRGHLLALHRTAVLRHDEHGQETLLCLLLRNYLHYNLYDHAEKLRAKAQKGEVWRSNQQLCRYLLYLGRIRAVQLDYTDAKDCLQQAARKAPAVAVGFRVIANKWLVVVRLLLGEVPEHSEFRQPGLQQPLQPYFALAQAVRSGDLALFGRVAEAHEAVFAADRTANLIVRLRHNVIRTGLRRINLAYSRISLADVAQKLGLASVEDTESILAKAIRDGGVEATINRGGGFMASRPTIDVYSTAQPQAAFHARVAFCLDIHNEAVKAMRFESGDGKQRLETAESVRERAMQDDELAKALEEEEGEDF